MELSTDNKLTPINTVCSYRWSYSIVKYSLAQVRTCCRTYPNENVSVEDMKEQGTDVFVNSKILLKKRKEMLHGVQDENCSICWNLEKKGIKSQRTSVDDFISYMHSQENAPKSLEQISFNSEKFSRSNRPTVLEIQTDNLCDLKCLYCQPEYSSRWESEQIKSLGRPLARPDSERLRLFRELFWKWYEEVKHSIQVINFLGGEPSLSEDFFELAQKISRLAPDDGIVRNLGIISNFNAKPERFTQFKEAIFDLGEKFEVVIGGSIESMGLRGEFIRDGLNWERFEQNFRDLASEVSKRDGSKPRIHLGFQIANNLLSVASMPQFVRWAMDLEKEFNIPINMRANVVSHPKYLSPFLLPNEFARHMDEAADIIEKHHSRPFEYSYGATWSKYGDYLRSLSEGIRTSTPAPEDLQELSRWVNQINSSSKKESLKHFPEYQSFFQEVCQKHPVHI